MVTATAILFEQKEEQLKELVAQLTAKQDELASLGRLPLAERGKIKNELRAIISTITIMIWCTIECRKMLSSSMLTQANVITVNSVVELENMTLVIVNKPRGCGACSATDDGKEIICVSPKARSIKAILNKRKGDCVTINDETKRVLNIQLLNFQ